MKFLIDGESFRVERLEIEKDWGLILNVNPLNILNVNSHGGGGGGI